jgi:predicted ATP-grasp superfamily ATP-dependent carboligase
MLFADQMGHQVDVCRASAGIRWMRLVTDLPTAALEILNGNLKVKEYLSSLFSFHIESVFCREDPFPGLMELALVPYLYMKRGY